MPPAPMPGTSSPPISRKAASGVFRKVTGDLEAGGVAVTEEQIRAKMDELMAQAIAQVKAGI